MRKEYKQPTFEVLARVVGAASLLNGSLGTSLKHPAGGSGLPDRAPAKQKSF